MTRFRSLLALVAASVLVLSACGDSGGVTSSPAATVNGDTISDGGFRDTLETLAENPEFAMGLVQVPVDADAAGGARPVGEEVDRVDAAFAAAVLELEIILELIDTEFDERGLSISEEELETTRQELNDQLTQLLGQMPDDYADGFVRWNTQLRLIRDDLAADSGEDEVTDEEVRAFYDENIAQFESQVCAQHILLETEEEAAEVLAELEAGADMGTLAEERSIDPSAAQNAGDLGCRSAEEYVAPFAEAITTGEVGEYLGPVETDFGHHVILVTSRGTTPFEDVSEQIRSQLEQQAAAGPAEAFGALLEELVLGADVSVSSRYGTWDGESGRVLPPEGPEGDTGTLTLG